MKSRLNLLLLGCLLFSVSASAEIAGVLMKSVGLEDGSIAVLYNMESSCKLMGNIRKHEEKKPPRIEPEVTWRIVINREACQGKDGQPKYTDLLLSAPIREAAKAGTKFTFSKE